MNFLSIKNIFRSFKYYNFRLYFSGQSISLIGTWIQRLAMPWLVYRLTNSPFLLGAVGFVGQVPTFLFTPFAGVLVDRWNKYQTLIITQVLAMIQALIIFFLYILKVLNIWQIFILSIFLAIINAFDMPLRQAFIIELIDNKEDLGNAIALNSLMVNMARLLGPSLAGILISLTNEGICFLVNAISYIFVIIFLLKMKISNNRRENKKEFLSLFKDLKEGFLYVFGFPPLRYIILLLALISLVGMPYTILMPIFASKILHGNAYTFGFLMAGSGIGALIAGLYLASRKTVLGLGRILAFSPIIFGLGLILFSLSRNFLLSFLMMIVTGFGMILNMTGSNTLLQTITEDDKRGRVMSFYTMAFIGIAPFGSLLAGTLASIIGAPNTLLFGGICAIIGGILFALKLPEIRRLVRPIYLKLGIISEIPNNLPSSH
ncbi:MAG: MFS transporter [candidate division WOR-3 bacterium]